MFYIYLLILPRYTLEKKTEMSKSMKGKGKRSVAIVKGDSGEQIKKTKGENGLKHSFHLQLSESLLQPSLKQGLKQCWKADQNSVSEFLDQSVLLIKDPFTCLSVNNFFSKDSSIHELIDELENQEIKPKNNDLYKFLQSSELKRCKNPVVRGLRQFLVNQVKPWLEEVTGIPLRNTIDMFCAKYNYTDYLLCHDDELMGKY